MKRSLQIFIVVVLMYTNGYNQHVFFHLEELIVENEVVQLDQDQNGILWMLANDCLISYNGYEYFQYAYNRSDSLVFSCFFISENQAYIGSKNGQIVQFNIEDKEWGTPGEISFGSPITKIDRSNEFHLIVSTYGNGLFKVDLNDMDNIINYNTPDYIYEFIGYNEVAYLATDRGVFKVDLNAKSATTLIHDGIVPFIDKRNEEYIWFVDYDKGLIQYNLVSNFKRIFSLDKMGTVNDLSISENNELIGTKEGLYEVRSDGSFLKWEDPERNIENVNNIFIDDENDLWIYDAHTGFWKGAINFKRFDSKIMHEIQAILFKNGHLVLGTEAGLFIGEIDNWEPRLIIKDINVTSCVSVGDYCFVGTYNKGVYVLDSNNNIVRHFNFSDGLADNAILNISKVDSVTVQISTLAGVQELSGLTSEVNSWKLGIPISGLSLNYVLDIFSDKSGIIYYGLDKSGLKISNSGNLIGIKETNENVPLGSIYSIGQSTDDSIWLSSEKLGVVKLKDNEVIDWYSPHGLDQVCYSIIPINDNLLIFVGDESIDIYDSDNHELLEYDVEIGLDKHQGFLNNYSKNGNQVWISHGSNIYLYEQSEKKSRTNVNAVIDRVEVNLDQVSLNKSTFAQSENNFTFYYSGILHRNNKRIYYSYQLVGFDNDWRSTQDRYVSYPHLLPGEYEFRIKASHDEFSPPSNFISYSFEIKRAFYNSFWFWFIISILIIGLIYYWIQRSKRERDLKIELDQKRIETQLINLKSQLNPHFMFNSFNTMIGLIEEDKNRGIEFIEHLTDFYRGVLEIGDDELISVESELELLQHYIHLLKERFGRGIQVSFKSEINNFRVPPLSLQMLIENAVKHNVVSDKYPLTVDVFLDGEFLVVRNNKQLKVDTNASFGIGLENLKRRYLILAGREIIVHSDDSVFEVRLPIIAN